jgi:hypothetical protein
VPVKRDPIALLKSFKIPYWERQGGDWATIECPFHNDKHDNLELCNGGIHKVTGKFKCFSCSAPGDIYSVLATTFGVPQVTIEAKADGMLGLEDNGYVDASLIEYCHSELLAADDWRKRMLTQHGINQDSIVRWRLGYYPTYGRITIPIKGHDGKYVNMRKYKYDADKNKVLGIKGGKNALWPLDAFESDTIYITEGEFKAILLWQNGFAAITGTSGAGSWNHESWSDKFKGKDVVLLLDIDDAGRKAAARICHYLYSYAKSIRNVFLSDVQGIPKGDVTDYFVKKQRTADNLRELVNATPPYTPAHVKVTNETLVKNDPIPVKLAHASRAEHNNKIITTTAVVSAKDMAPYIIPAKCTVVCNRDKPYCPMCRVFNMAAAHTFEIPDHSPAVLNLINATELQQNEILKQASGINGACKVASFKREAAHNVEEIRLIPQIAIGHTTEEQVTRKAFYVGSDGIASNHTYTFEGRVCAEPKDGHATVIMYAKEAAEDDLDNFTTTEDLSLFQPKEWTKDSVNEKLTDIYEDFEANVTNIFQRRDLHLFYDLIWHTVLYIDFQGRQIKGWGDALVIGDSGQGKSECSSRLSVHYKCGERVDTKRASVAGLVGGLQATDKRWFITWGTIPLNDRRLVLLEEIKGIGAPELSKMTDMRSSGVAEITKIERAKTTARTRLIWISNPRSDSNISTYNYGVDAVKELIGGLEDIRRFDMVMAVASGEVPTTVINSKVHATKEHKYTSIKCQQLVSWAWSRRKEDIIIECEDEILAAATRMGNAYSSACPIVEPSDQRLKILRLATGLACRVYSTDEEGEKVYVKDCHVQVVEEFLNRIYSSKALGYKEYSAAQMGELSMDNPDVVVERIKSAPNSKETVKGLIEAEMLRVEDVINLTEWDLEASNAFIGFLIRNGCIRRNRRGGYRKTSAFINLLKALDRGEKYGPLDSKTMRDIVDKEAF